MKILSIITTIIIIGYIFCATEGQIFDINLSSPLTLDVSSIPDGKIPKNTIFYFRFQKYTNPILIHITLPEEVKTENFKLEYNGFEEQPSDQDIYAAKYTNIDLYDEVLYEGNGREFTYMMDNEMPYIALLFTGLSDLTGFSILVEKYEKDKKDDDDKKGENIYEMNIYDVEYLTQYYVNLKQTNDFYYFGVNSTQQHTGDLILNLIVPKGIEEYFTVYGFPLRTGKIEELLTINQTEDQLSITKLKSKEDEASETYRYLFTLNEEQKYFLIFVSMKTPINNIKVYVREKEEGEEEEKEEKPKNNVYRVAYSTEYQIDKDYLGANLDGYAFYLLSDNPHNGNVSVQVKVKKGVPKQSFSLNGYAKKNTSFNDEEGRLTVNIEYKGALEQDEYDIYEYNFKLDNELYFLIAVSIKEDLDYLSFYLQNSTEPDSTEPDSTGPDSTEPDPMDHIHIYNLLFLNEQKIDKKNFPQEIIPANDKFYFRMENNGFPQIIELRTGLDEEPEFGVFIQYFNYKPSDEEIYDDQLNYSEVVLEENVLEDNKKVFIYYVNIPDIVPYFSILVIPKQNLNSFSIYVKSQQEYNYLFDYTLKYNITTTDKYAKIALMPKEKNNNGEYLMNIILPHSEKKLFDIMGLQIDSYVSKMTIEKMDVQLVEKYKIENYETEGSRDLYHYSFTLNEGNKYYMISIQMLEKLDHLSCYFYFKKKEYKVQYTKEFQIDKKYLLNSSEYFNTFLSEEPHIGDNYIKLRVKNDVKEDSFIFEGYGNKQFNGTNVTNAVALDINYKYNIPEEQYNILLYHFKTNENSAYFVINMQINNTVDFLSISFTDKIEKKSNESEQSGQSESEKSESGGLSPIVLAIIIVASILVFLLILYFVCRKLGCLRKNDVTSNDIETVDQIIV